MENRDELEQSIRQIIQVQYERIIQESNKPNRDLTKKIKENIEGGHAPRSTLSRSICIRIEFYLLPLITKLIQTEFELRSTYHIPFSNECLSYLRDTICNIIDNKWPLIVDEAYHDAQQHEIYHMGSVASYKDEELRGDRDEYKKNNDKKNNVLDELDRLLQEASAAFILRSKLEFSKPPKQEIFKEIIMGDKYVTGQAGSVGPGSYSHDITFNQIWTQVEGTIDLPSLAAELGLLRQSMKKEATEPEQDVAVGAVANAEQAAKVGNGPKALESLKSAGKWALDLAEKIGVGVATAAIKTALGV